MHALQGMSYQLHSSRCFSSTPHDTSTAVSPSNAKAATPQSSEEAQRIVLYRGRGMVPFRVLVRLKIFQLGGVAALAIPINTFLVEVTFSANTGLCRCTLWYLFLPHSPGSFIMPCVLRHELSGHINPVHMFNSLVSKHSGS